MSNSRLEKFIYAICGMEVDDLPTPLSRIETLWNCLITGETPDFEPLSRNEKYLMSMLTGDVDALPEPTSRSEKLLYKIATGETDLTDVPGYLSRYEELLKQLIENGGIGGTDFEYVLYTLNDSFSTLYSTAEAPVRSAILKGNTMVNLVTNVASNDVGNYSSSPCKIKLMRNLTTETLTIIFNVTTLEMPDGSDGIMRIGGGWSGVIRHKPTVGINKVLYNCTQQSNNWLGVFSNSSSYVAGQRISISDVIVLEGDQTQEDIHYFEGMQSVKMPVLKTTGKNFKQGSPIGSFNENNGEYVFTNMSNRNGIRFDVDNTMKIGDTITVSVDCKKNEDFGNNLILLAMNNDVELINKSVPFSTTYERKSLTITIPNNTTHLFLGIGTSLYRNVSFSNIQIEKGSTATTYEPYKSNILTTSEEVELRGIGDVQDTLDLLTGEVTERIGEIVLDGSETIIEWQNTNVIDGIKAFSFRNCADNNTTNVNSLSDTYITYQSSGKLNMANGEGVSITSNHCYLKILTSKLETSDIDGLKKYLSQNPITVQYELAEESIETVVLSTLDQDGQPTKLKTFNDITHVSIEAEDLLPTVDLEVPTKIEETLSSLPTQMIDISETQQSLNEKIDEQAENIKEVSAAMTEIRNDIL